MDWFDTILWPIMYVVAWIMVGFHSLFTAIGLDPAGGAAWALSIVGLVILMRIVLIPLFVKQIKASRGLQMISPELQAVQKKYKGKSDPASREAMSRETMELYRKHGTNPFSSCLPILAQSPIFFALFRVLYNLPAVANGTYERDAIGPITAEVAKEATEAEIFGAPISSWFLSPEASVATRIVTAVLIVAMSATTFTTQRQLTQKNMPASALQGPMAQQQKMLLYVLPLVFAISGVNFPIGVLVYWTTTNIWSMGQQFYVIRRNPTPGSEAERALNERRARKAAAKGIVIQDDKPAIEDQRPRGQRTQPKRKDRAKGTARPAGTGADAADGGAGAAPGAADEGDGAQPGGAVAGSSPAAGKKPVRRTPGSGATPTGAGTTGARAAGAKPAGAKPAAKSAGAKPAAAKPAAKSAGAKPAGANPAAARKPAAAAGKPVAGSPAGTGPTGARKPAAAAGNPGDATPAGASPAAARKPARTTGKPAGAKPAAAGPATGPSATTDPAGTGAGAATSRPPAEPGPPRAPRAPRKRTTGGRKGSPESTSESTSETER